MTRGYWDPKSDWDVHPDYDVEVWQYEVANGDTRISYIDWVNSRIAEDADDGE